MRKNKRRENRFFLERKRAAIGATMTWVVATIIIFFVIFLFVLGSQAMATSGKFKKIFSLRESGSEQIAELGSAIASEQMLLALLETKVDGRSVKELVINDEKDLLADNLKLVLAKIPYCKNKKSFKRSSWSFYYNDVDQIEILFRKISRHGDAPYLDLPRTDEPTLSIVYLSNNKIVKFFENCRVNPGISIDVKK
jgi:hypothetical protein